MNSLIENYINGNLTDAKRQARRHSFMSIVNALRDDFGKNAEEAVAIADFLKGQGSFQAAADAEYANT